MLLFYSFKGVSNGRQLSDDKAKNQYAKDLAENERCIMLRKLFLFLTFLSLVLLLLVACNEQPAQAPAASRTPAPDETPAPTATALLDEIVSTRVPAPTATPGILEQAAQRLVVRAGWYSTTFLGVPIDTWIDLGISLASVLIAYLVGSVVINRVLPPLTERTPTPLDGAVLKANGSTLRWLFVVIALYLATQQLSVLGPAAKVFLGDVYFSIGLALSLRMILRLIRVFATWYRGRAIASGREEELSSVINLLTQVGNIIVWMLAFTVFLSHFGVNVSAFAAALGLGGLAISLAARDTVADAIAGMIILVDRPFRVGDRIEVKAVDTWGDVVQIGLRTTRIRTGDNRLVVVPNSNISANEVINYSYPDPNYRIETHVGIAYGSDIEQLRQVILAAVRVVDGVLPNKPVDVLYMEMNNAAMIIRVRWWIETYADARQMLDRVHTAMQQALEAAGIKIWPYVGHDVNLQVESRTAKSVSEAFWSQRDKDARADASQAVDS